MEEEGRKTVVALLPGVISELLLAILLLLFPVPPNSGTTCVSDHLSSPFPGIATGSNTALLLYLVTSSQLALSVSLRSHPFLAQPISSLPSSSSSSAAAAAAVSTTSVSSRKRKRRPRSRSRTPTSSIPFPSLAVLPNPDSYPSVFNMTSPTFEWLSGLLEPLLDCRDPAGSHLNLSAHLRLAIGLFRLATGSSYDDVSTQFRVSLSTSKFCTKQLCRVLCTNFRFWLAFPSPSDILSVSSAFQSLGGGGCGLPNCCGILSCTHFEQKHEEESITAQVVVDASSKILSITAGYRGNKGDLEILKNSTFYGNVTGGQLLNSPPVCLNGVAVPQYVMGNGAYPLLPWLMVPFGDPAPLSCEEEFNAAHRSLCSPALRTIASLKKWGILSRPMDEATNLAVACIGACAILHNVLLTREDYSALSDWSEDYSRFYYSSHDAGGASISLQDSPEKSALDTRNALAADAKGRLPMIES